MSGKVVVNRCMSLDGFIAGPGHSMDWWDDRALADFVAPDDLAEIAAATGAMLVGRRTWEVGDRMAAENPGSVDYPFSGPMFLLTPRRLGVSLGTGSAPAALTGCVPFPSASGPGSRVRCHAEMRMSYLSLLLGRVVTRGRAGAALPDCPDRRKDLNRDSVR